MSDCMTLQCNICIIYYITLGSISFFFILLNSLNLGLCLDLDGKRALSSGSL